MQLEHYPINRLKKEILKIIATHLNLKTYKVFLFGSRVKGNAHQQADIDIGIEGPQILPAGKKIEIQEKLEKLPMLYKIDLIDFKKVSPRFKKYSKKWIEPLN